MTNFVKDMFNTSGEYITYGADHKFVARFKYQKNAKGSFVTFLIKNFTVEEYFGQLDAKHAPLEIVKTKGYLLPHIKKHLRQTGYPVTVAGYQQMIKDQIANRTAH